MLRAQPSLGVSGFGTLHKVVTYVIASLGLFALSMGDLLGPAFKALLVASVALSWFAEGALIRQKRYQTLWSLGLVLCFALQVTRALSGHALLLLAVEFSAVLQISRLFSRTGAREAQQITVLAFLHLIAATVLTTSLSYALIFLGFVALIPWMLTLSYLRYEAEQAYALPEAELLRKLDDSAALRPAFLLGTLALALPILLVTGLLFVAFPRVGLGLFSFGYNAKQRIAGFGGQVDLGEFGAIREDPTVIARVRTGGHGWMFAPSTLRLRGTSFDHYDGRRWSRTTTELLRAESLGELYYVERWPRPDDARISVELEPLAENVIFLPQGTVALEIPPRIRAGVATHRHISRALFEFRYLDATDQGLSYVAIVSRARSLVSADPPSATSRTRYLQIPPKHQHLVGLAQQITKNRSTTISKAAAITAFLRDDPQFHYTTDQPRNPGPRPLEHFLFVSKSGHCEYFASALAIMLRAIGIPSRHVMGFLGGRYNRFGEYIAVRQGDAHSWVEAFVDGVGWVTLDPTPLGRASMDVEAGLFVDARALIDALRSKWDRHVVSYDLPDQLRYWERLQRWLARLRPKSTSEPEKHPTIKPPSVPHAGWWILMPGAAGLLGFFLYRQRKNRDRSTRTGESSNGLGLYRELERWLLKHGQERAAHLTPLEYANILKAQSFFGADAVERLTERYMQARYSHQLLTVKEQEQLLIELRRSHQT